MWRSLLPQNGREALSGTYRIINDGDIDEFSRGGAVIPRDTRDQVVFGNDNTQPFPDIENDRSDYDILSWDMAPGDCVAFNARVIHGGSGNLAGRRDLKVFNT